MSASTATTELSPSQRRCLDFVRTFIGEHGYSPTLREVCDGLGWTATNSAVEMLDRLQAKKYLERTKGRARTIRLLEPALKVGCGLEAADDVGGMTESERIDQLLGSGP